MTHFSPADGSAATHASAQHQAPSPERTDRHPIWITGPIMIALLGLLGTGITAVFQQYSTILLERHKFENQLIQKALSEPNRHDAAKELEFYSKIGLLRGLTEGKIEEATKGDASELPVFHGAALRDGIISVSQAKTVLSHLTALNSEKDPKGSVYYTGPLDNHFDLDFQIAVMRFQKEKKLEVDGLIGPQTVLALWDACSICADILRKSEGAQPKP